MSALPGSSRWLLTAWALWGDFSLAWYCRLVQRVSNPDPQEDQVFRFGENNKVPGPFLLGK